MKSNACRGRLKVRMSAVNSATSTRRVLISSISPMAIGFEDSSKLYLPVLRMVGRTFSVTHLRKASEAACGCEGASDRHLSQ